VPSRRIEEVLSQAAEAPAEASRASAQLKSRIYSALMLSEANQGPLRSLSETKAEGRGLCIFEQIVEIAPFGSPAKQYNYCRICHGRFLGERFEDPPLYWSGCPYAEFKKG
jgi:hypothetical protein